MTKVTKRLIGITTRPELDNASLFFSSSLVHPSQRFPTSNFVEIVKIRVHALKINFPSLFCLEPYRPNENVDRVYVTAPSRQLLSKKVHSICENHLDSRIMSCWSNDVFLYTTCLVLKFALFQKNRTESVSGTPTMISG